MQRIAFKMKLFEGCREEYKRRHANLFPELKELLKQTGVSDYSIFLDETSNDLFAILKLEEGKTMEALPANPVMQRWWAHMADLMETHPDLSPVVVPLQELFHLP
ncbi:L-rhamnose mutarotase [Niabella beijingensis]|uniref:L-rhamnose mutarotase n=1 Tax=Niabella beijingensis TaxID=2872700 RepID=UPI001CBC49D6|nr:L-rhamnose mutarotase [Niabella beijingensis]MBZ4192182.1 L-rhamnose mutarotase [Niabella beijingensis]